VYLAVLDLLIDREHDKIADIDVARGELVGRV
jgi:hypothetical protein